MTTDADPTAPRDAPRKGKIFISYSRKDMTFADKMEAALKARGFEPLIDREQIYAFEPWWTRIQSLIAEADTIIFVLSPDAVTSDICTKEVAFAASLNKKFAPIVCRPVDLNKVPEALRQLNFIACDETRFDVGMDQLAEALLTDIEWIRKHTELCVFARKWENAGRPSPSGLLLRPPVLEESEHWIASRPVGVLEPALTTREFISESRKHENALIAEAKAAQKRKRRMEFALMGVLVVISLAGIAYAIWTNFDYLKLRGEMLADNYVPGRPKRLTDQRERDYAQMVLQPEQIISFRECTRCPEMIVVPAGELLMGSPETERSRDKREGPQHKVTIVRNFAVGKFEVTFDEWKACVDGSVCVDAADQGWGRGTRPVINVSWDEGQQYVKWLSERTRKKYRLLSEAEWEYAARARSDKAYPWGDDVGSGNANCWGCGGKWDGFKIRQTTPIGSFAPNAFGLYDMHGNVSEWVEDCAHPDYVDAPLDGTAWTTMCPDEKSRIVRGGAWRFGPEDTRSASRAGIGSAYRYTTLGFRVARTFNP